MEIIQKQAAFFFKNKFEAPFEELALKVKNILGNVDAQYIPIPSDAPPEIPRLVLPYKERNLSFNFSKIRFDVFFNDLSLVSNSIISIVGIFSDDYKMSIDRIGFVQKSFLESEMSPLLDLFVETHRPAGVKELAVRINLEKNVGIYTCNSIEALSVVSVTKLENGALINKKGILIERDINTLEEKRSEYLFDKNNLPAFIGALNTEADNLTLLQV